MEGAPAIAVRPHPTRAGVSPSASSSFGSRLDCEASGHNAPKLMVIKSVQKLLAGSKSSRTFFSRSPQSMVIVGMPKHCHPGLQGYRSAHRLSKVAPRGLSSRQAQYATSPTQQVGHRARFSSEKPLRSTILAKTGASRLLLASYQRPLAKPLSRQPPRSARYVASSGGDFNASAFLQSSAQYKLPLSA